MMKKTLLITGLTVVAIAVVATVWALQGRKQVKGVTATAPDAVPRNSDLASTQMCNYSVTSVAAQAKAIAQSVPSSARDRDTQIADATRDWVVSHIAFANQVHPSSADVTLRAKVGNDASESVLIAAMLRADGIPAQVQLVPVSDAAGYFGNSMPMRYIVMAGSNQGIELDVPFQHRQPQSLTDSGTLPW